MNISMEFFVARSPDQIALCKKVLLDFRFNLNHKTYVELILNMINEEGFKLVYILNENHTRAIAFIGYRFMQMLRTGSIIYIDDLYTDPQHRGKGYAGALLEYANKDALKKNIQSIHLDSGYMLHNAHRLYLNNGYVLSCNHFAKEVR